mgnify:FL=1
MIDMHNHILYGIDDGCKTIEESIETIKNMKKIGFNSIVLTPHYIEDSSFKANNNLKLERLEILKEELLKNNIDVNLFLGNEIFINESINELIINKEIRSINNTRYILIELPFNNQILNLDDYLYELKLKGYKIIIAHPERYTYFKDNYKEARKLYDSGVLFQVNYGSIIGQYGSSSLKLVKKLLKDDMVDFISTDIHKPSSSLFDKFDDIKHKIIKIIGEDKFKDISYNNILKVINDEDI